MPVSKSTNLKTDTNIFIQPVNNKTVVNGGLSAQYYYIKQNNFQLEQPGSRFRLNIKNLFGQPINFQTRSRSQYFVKTFNRNSSKEWRNRLYNFQIDYKPVNSRASFSTGRIIPKMYGIGYIDGLQINWQALNKWQTGLLAGTKPQWYYIDNQPSINKYGGYVTYSSQSQDFKISSSTAFVGEYHNTETSREFVYFQNQIYSQNGLSVYSSADVDIFKSWRQEKMQDSAQLTSLYFNINYPITKKIKVGFSVNNRRNYYTFSTQKYNLDMSFRQNYRLKFQIKPTKTTYLQANLGFKKRNIHQKHVPSLNLSLNQTNFTPLKLSANIWYYTFKDYYFDGQNVQFRLGKNFDKWSAEILAGLNQFNYNLGVMALKNQWVRFNLSTFFTKHFYTYANYEYEFDGDLSGYKIYLDCEYKIRN